MLAGSTRDVLVAGGRECQASAWRSHHKRECPVLSRLCRSHAPDFVSDLLLASRLHHRLGADESLPPTAHLDAAAAVEAVNASSSAADVLAMEEHAGEMARSDPEWQRAVVAMAQVGREAGLLPPAVGAAQLQRTLAQFRCNNFALTDPLFNSKGAAVLPHGALLNHCCTPACVPLPQRRSLVVRFRCLRDVAEGEELTHAYVDPSDPTADRQAVLQQHYMFRCHCPRCMTEAAAGERLRELCASGAPFAAQQQESQRLSAAGCVEHLMQAGLDGVPLALLAPAPTRDRELALAAEMARRAAAEGEPPREEALLRQALHIRERHLHPLHRDCITAHSALCGACVAAGRAAAAVPHCAALVGAYRRLYPGAHPVLGLQLYTLGDLLQECEGLDVAVAVDVTAALAASGVGGGSDGGSATAATAARLCWQEAAGMLAVSHGEDHALVAGLRQALQQR